MLNYKITTRITSQRDGTGEVVVNCKEGELRLPLDLVGGTKVHFREPDESWEEKCRQQHAEWAIPKKSSIKLAIFMHFGGMYYRYDTWTSVLTIGILPTSTVGCIILILALLLTRHVF